MVRTEKPATLLFIVITAAFLCAALFCPPLSHAKMKPIDENIIISWAPQPPLFFRVWWSKTPELRDTEYEGPPWYGPWFKDKNLSPDDRIVPTLREEEEVITFWPSTCPHDICRFEYSRCWCDWDGLACRSYTSLGPVTYHGCVGTQKIVAEEIDAEGKNVVYPPTQEGGPFVATEGNPFLKIYFPENNTVTMKHWEGIIVAGQHKNVDSYTTCPCADSHCNGDITNGCTSIDPSQSYGSIHISGLKVTIHGGGWVQISTNNDAIDFESISYGIIKGRWDP